MSKRTEPKHGANEWVLHGRRCRCALLNQGVKLIQVNRLYQVMLESCLVAFADIVFHPETGESDREVRFRGELLHQMDSIAIGQSQIADEHVKLLLRAQIDGRLKIEGRLHMIAAPPK